VYYGVRAEVTGEKWSASSRVARARGVAGALRASGAGGNSNDPKEDVP
jgi:hypothetical protein